MLGGLFIAVTLLLPRGIVGTLHHWTALRRDRALGAAEDGVAEPRRRSAAARCGCNERLATEQASTAASASLYLDGVTVSFDGFGAQQSVASRSSRARCAPSSARTAPARRR